MDIVRQSFWIIKFIADYFFLKEFGFKKNLKQKVFLILFLFKSQVSTFKSKLPIFLWPAVTKTGNDIWFKSKF